MSANSRGQAPSEFVLREAAVLGEDGNFEGPVDVLVCDGEIRVVGPGLIATGIPSFDFSGLWLMPGIVDAHIHVSVSTLDLNLRRLPSLWMLDAAAAGRRMLEGGVTFARDAGSADAGLREGFARGLASGSRLQISISLISQTGGHGDGYLPGADLECPPSGVFPTHSGPPDTSWTARTRCGRRCASFSARERTGSSSRPPVASSLRPIIRNELS